MIFEAKISTFKTISTTLSKFILVVDSHAIY